MNSLASGEMGPRPTRIEGEQTPDRFRCIHAMETQGVNSRTYCFEEFSLDVRTGELTNAGKKIPLREQSLQLLLALLERPGELLTREELMARLWPPGTFVDADQGLNKAMKHLREALGDSADQPHFIETFPRRGYRFIAKVESSGTAAEKASASTPVLEQPPRKRKYAMLAALALGAVVIVFGANIGGWRSTVMKRLAPSHLQITSLAVLPLED